MWELCWLTTCLLLANFYLWNGKMLLNLGKLALSEDCCCDEPDVNCTDCRRNTWTENVQMELDGVTNRDPEVCADCADLNGVTWELTADSGVSRCSYLKGLSPAAACNYDYVAFDWRSGVGSGSDGASAWMYRSLGGVGTMYWKDTSLSYPTDCEQAVVGMVYDAQSVPAQCDHTNSTCDITPVVVS